MNAALRLTAATLLSAFALGAMAQGAATPGVDKRQDRHEARIEQGAASGSLTGREQRRLHLEQKAVARAEARAKGDGTVTAKERARLHHMQNHASRDIKRQKRDAQTAAN